MKLTWVVWVAAAAAAGAACSEGRKSQAVPQAASCQPSSCAPGTYCSDAGTCEDILGSCAAAGACSCAIVNRVGQLPLDEDAVSLVLPAGASWQAQAVLINAEHSFPQQRFDWRLEGDAGASFTLDGSTLRATAVPGRALLTARLGEHVLCRAPVLNLGPAPDDGRVRIHLYDQATGAPVAAAHVLTHVDGAAAPLQQTDAVGVAITAAPVAGVLTVTAWAPAYDYLTVAGLQRAGADVALALTPMQQAQGGFSGRLDYTPYEAAVTEGLPQELRFALAGGSMPLERFLRLNFSGEVLQDKLLGLATPCEVSEPGCYAVPTQSGKRPTFMPGPVVLDAVAPVKSAFDVRLAAGRRLVWALGSELAAATGNEILDLAVQAYAGQPNKVRELVESLLHLVAGLGAGTHRPLALPAIDDATWAQQTAIKELHARPPLPGVPVLDRSAAGLGPLRLQHPLTEFTDVALADFPEADGLDTVLAVTGVYARGMGFVPLGLGLGLDSLDDLLLRGEGTFDRRISGMALCGAGSCRAGVPSHTAEGHLPLFYAPPAGGLEHFPQLTVLLGLSLRGTMQDLGAEVLAGRLLPGPPSAEGLAGATLMQAALPADAIVGRRYGWTARSAAQVECVTLTLASGRAWQIYVPTEAGAVTLPAAPPGWEDLGDETTVSHLTAETDGVALAELVGYGPRSLANFAESVRGFALRVRTLALQ